jgi:DNA modification methylase
MTDLQSILDAGGPWKQARIIGEQLLINGDCREVMAVLPKVDAVVTDPPYGIKMDRGVGTGGFSGFGDGKRRARHVARYQGGWDDSRPDPETVAAMCALAERAIIWGGQFFADLLPPQGKWLFWDKCQTMPSFGDGELAWTNLLGDSVKKFTYNGNGLMAKEKDRQHPTQKPIALMEWCLGFLPDARTILDPFMGSGTTLVACQRLGRQGIGIELDADYFATACRRVQEVVNNPPLFIPEPPKPVQEPLL